MVLKRELLVAQARNSDDGSSSSRRRRRKQLQEEPREESSAGSIVECLQEAPLNTRENALVLSLAPASTQGTGEAVQRDEEGRRMNEGG